MLINKCNIGYLNSQCDMMRIMKKESAKSTYQHRLFKKLIGTNNISFKKIDVFKTFF